jgi:uncharacterized membrane protein
MDMQPAAIEALLEQVRFFHLLDAAERRALAARFEIRQVPAGSVLFRLGDPGDDLYVIGDGTVEVHTRDILGQKISIAMLGQGEILGELSLIDDGPRTATATTEQDCTLLVLKRGDLLDFIRRNPEASIDLMAMLAERIRETHSRLRRLAARNANEAIQTGESRIERITDLVAGWAGSLWFFALHCVIYFGWMLWNIFSDDPFDPYPFGLLTMAVSLEAILLSIMVLLTQNRQAARDRIRSDVEYEVNVTAGLQIVELHSKLDAMNAALLGRLAQLERTANRALPHAPADS